jgi:hypothetical protein
MNVWAICIGGAVYLAVLLLVLIPQLKRIEARREEIGDREPPLRRLVAGIAIVGVSGFAGLAMIVWGSGAVSLAGWAVAGLGFAGGIQVILSAAHRAQRT